MSRDKLHNYAGKSDSTLCQLPHPGCQVIVGHDLRRGRVRIWGISPRRGYEEVSPRCAMQDKPKGRYEAHVITSVTKIARDRFI